MQVAHPALLPLLALLFPLAACQSTRTVAFSSEPPGAMIQIDGKNIGVTPITHPIDFQESPRVIVGAIMAGYHTEQLAVDKSTPAVKRAHLNLVLMADEAWNVTTTCEATNSWMRIQVEPTLDKETVWQKMIDSVTSRYSNLEQLDAASGYIKTVSEVRRFQGRSGYYEVRTRFLGAISSREPLVYKFKLEAEVSDGYGRWTPYDRVFTEDASLLQELQDRLGAK